MKQIFLSLITFFVLSACSSDDQQVPTIINNPIEQSEIVGVWENGDYFMSFGNNGYFISYISDDFLDCGLYRIPAEISEFDGLYEQKESTIGTFSNGFCDNSVYLISELNDTILKIKQLLPKNVSITLHRSNRTPANENHILIGKTYTSQWSDDDTTPVRTEFINGNTAIRTSTHKDADGWPLYLRYVIFDNTLYYKTYFRIIGEIPTEKDWGGKAGTGKVSIWELSFDSTEEISSHTIIKP